jgi:predicted CoA-binding protein/RimJ/RimL family protein N-acetyltransferase
VASDVESPAYPAHWEADVVLRDGGTAHVRPITPQDADDLQRFHLAQSPESVYLRFFAPMPRLSDHDLYRFTHVDHVDRVAFVVTVGGAIIGVGRYDRVEPTTAEVAFNISDAHHGRGLGSVLLEHLAAAARENGVHRFLAEVLPQNRKMISVFRDAGYEVAHAYDDGVVSLSFDIDPTEKSIAVMEAREHRAESLSVAALLNPRSVVLIGASRREATIGHRLLQDLLAGGFAGRLSVVHPEADAVLGVPTARRLADVPTPVDLAVVAVPAPAVVDVVRECAQAGVRGLVVLSGGFAETGPEGLERQRELVRLARANGMRVIGPKSWGVINADPDVRLNVSLMDRLPVAGRLGLFCQSGGPSVLVMETAAQRGLGVSTFVSAGNRADVSGNDCMQFWEEDPGTDVVGLYLESVGNPRKFARSRGGCPAPSRWSSSRRGLPAGNRPAMRCGPAALRARPSTRCSGRAGACGSRTWRSCSTSRSCSSSSRSRRATGRRRRQLRGAGRPRPGRMRRPWPAGSRDPEVLPLLAGAAEYRSALEAAVAAPDVDAVVAALVTPLGLPPAELADVLAVACAGARQPVIVCMLGREAGAALTERLSTGPQTVPVYPTVEEAVRALAVTVRYAAWRSRDLGPRVDPDGRDTAAAEALVLPVVRAAPEGVELDPQQAAALLACYGIELWPAVPVPDADAAVAAAEELGWPVALKTTAPHLRHRADLGASGWTSTARTSCATTTPG